MLWGLVTYAQSVAVNVPRGPDRISFEEQLARSGYSKVSQNSLASGGMVERYEMHVPSTPKHHWDVHIELVTDGDYVVQIYHDESFADVPD